MLIYLILPVLSTVEAVEVTRRASAYVVLACQEHYLPMQLACVFTVFKKLVYSISVPHAYFSCTRMGVIRYTHGCNQVHPCTQACVCGQPVKVYRTIQCIHAHCAEGQHFHSCTKRYSTKCHVSNLTCLPRLFSLYTHSAFHLQKTAILLCACIHATPITTHAYIRAYQWPLEPLNLQVTVFSPEVTTLSIHVQQLQCINSSACMICVMCSSTSSNSSTRRKDRRITNEIILGTRFT